jgi:hypothetical protein
MALCEHELNAVPTLWMPCDAITPVMLQEQYSVEISSREDALAERPGHIGDLTCYTDGSKMEERSAAGIYFTEEVAGSSELALPLGNYPTVF